jgi:hypothetical protein
MNPQNTHILEKLKDATEAVRNLVNADLTITHIQVEGVHPRINLLSAPKPHNRLPISMTTTRRMSKGYETEITACVNGCEISWLEKS